MANLEEALKTGDAETVFKEAHTVKGEAGVIFAETLSVNSRELEAIGRSGDLSEGQRAFGRVKKELDRLKDYYTEHFNKG